MKYNKSQKRIKNFSASFGAIATGFLIGLFLHGLFAFIPLVDTLLINTANAETLSVSCSVSTTTPTVGGTVTWSSNVSGGTGSYTFSWSGTEALSGSTGSVNKAYTTTGTKTASISITSGGSSASCSSSINVTTAPTPDPDPDPDPDPTPDPDPDPTPTPDPSPAPTSSGGGGGGGTILTFKIRNEKVERVATSTALVTWDTNLQAQSRVFYDTASHASAALPLVEYATSTSKADPFVIEHSMTIANLKSATAYYFRPAAYRFGDVVSGIELSLPAEGEKVEQVASTTPETIVPVEQVVCSEYLLEPIKLGADNSIVEVLKLQTFLNDFEGFDLEVTGFYDTTTFNAVKTFQEKYASDILEPWGMDLSTGYVYITTIKKINEIYCNKFIDFDIEALTQDEQQEVIDFRNLLESLRAQGLPIPEDLNVGLEDGASDTSLAIEVSEESFDINNTNNTSGIAASVVGFADSTNGYEVATGFFNTIKDIALVIYRFVF